MTNMDTKRKSLSALNEIPRANALNNLYLRFDTDNDNAKECLAVLENVICDMNLDRILIKPHAVTVVFKTIHSNKARGPDNMSVFVLRTFAEVLSPAWHKLFQFSIDTHTVPVLWKKSVIIPVPKKGCPQGDNDYRPVTLTSNIFKSLERLMVEELCTDVEPLLDKYQLAYTKNLSTSDAIAT